MEITSLSSLPLKSRLFFFWGRREAWNNTFRKSLSRRSHGFDVCRGWCVCRWILRCIWQPWEKRENKRKKGEAAPRNCLNRERILAQAAASDAFQKHAASNLLSRRRNTSRAQNFYLQLSFCSKCNRRSRDPETLNAVWKAGQIEAIYPPDM